MRLAAVALTPTTTHVALVGSLDVEGVDAVYEDVRTHVVDRGRPTVVDLSQLDMLTSLGMAMLLDAARSLRRHRAGLVLLAPRPRVERSIRLCGVDEVLPIAVTLEEAHRLLQEGPRVVVPAA